MNYVLPRLMGVTQIAYDINWERKLPLQHWTTKELLDELDDHNIRAVHLWLAGMPFSGPWCWHDQWGNELCTEGTWGEDMDAVWTHRGIDVFIVRFMSEAWAIREYGCNSGGTQQLITWANEPTYDIARGLFERYGWSNKTIIFTDWEQDWGISGQRCRGLDDDGVQEYPWLDASPWWSTQCITNCEEDGGLDCYNECGDVLLASRAKGVGERIERRQEAIERARAEFPNANLRILHAVTVNRFPGNESDNEWTVVEMIPTMKRQPDMIAASWHVRNASLVAALDWIQDVTGYPRIRLMLNEIGEWKDGNQYNRIMTESTRARCWGVRSICVWLWKQSWCDDRQYGLFYQHQPCAGKVVFDGPRPGYWALRDLIDQPFDFEGCG